jgi:hypothetical protein
MQMLADMGVLNLEIKEGVVKTAAANLRTRPASEAYSPNEFNL